MKLLQISILFLSFSFFGYSQTKQTDPLQDFLSLNQLSNASVGFCVVNVDSGQIEKSHNALQSLTPASSLKTITAAVALKKLGEDFVPRTTYSLFTPSEKVGQKSAYTGLLKNLDPSFGSRDFPEIYGNVVDSFAIAIAKNPPSSGMIWIENEEPWPLVAPSTAQGDVANYYGAGGRAFNYLDNKYAMHFSTTGGQVKLLRTEPADIGIDFTLNLKTNNSNRDLAYIYGTNGSKTRRVEGSLPKNKVDFVIYGSLNSPAETFKNALESALAERGLNFTLEIKNKVAKLPRTELIYTKKGLTMAGLLQRTLHKSVNTYADWLYKMPYGAERDFSYANGNEMVKLFLDHNKISRKGWHMHDGSGLSRSNAIPTKTIAQVLAAAIKEPSGEVLLQAIKPLAGDTALRAKSGYISGVRAYAGYYISPGSKKRYAFSLIVNNYDGSSSKLRTEMKKMLTEFFAQSNFN